MSRMDTPAISIIVINWNAEKVISRCLSSLREANLGSAEIIVIDNASSDRSVGLLRAEFPEVKLVTNDVNIGFAAANNQAAGLSAGQNLLFLNPDTEVSNHNALAELQNYITNHPDIGVIAPQLRNPDGSIQRSAWWGYPGLSAAIIDAFYLWKIPWLPCIHRSEVIGSKLVDATEVDHLLGAFMLIPRKAWDEVGPMDDRYFLFLEETEWCRRAKRSGWRVVYYPKTYITHFGQHSMRQQPSQNLPHLYRSYCRFYRESQNSTRLGLALLKIIILWAVIIRFCLWFGRTVITRWYGMKDQAWSMLNGYIQVLRELPSM